MEQNLQRISELKEESARAQLGDAVQRAEATEGAALDGAAVSALAPAAATAGSSGSAAAVVTEAGAAPAPAALGTPRAVPARRAAASAAHSQAPRHATRASGGAVPCAALSPAAEAAADEAQRRRGLYSGLEMEEELKNHWFAVSFVSKLGKVRGTAACPVWQARVPLLAMTQRTAPPAASPTNPPPPTHPPCCPCGAPCVPAGGHGAL